MKPYVLIVEDEAILYDRLQQNLEKEGFDTGPYTASVAAAKIQLQTKRPDVVLLDIDLQGEASGIDLGKDLTTTYKIPFIYLTQHQDDRTFYKGLESGHDHFMVKTKPGLEIKEVVRAIQTVISRQSKDDVIFEKEGVFGLTNYLDKLKEGGKDDISKVPIPYDEICFFTLSPYKPKDDETESQSKLNEPFSSLRTNYLWFLTQNDKKYLLKSSLKELVGQLPYNFVRINDKYVVNLSSKYLKGRINGSRLSVAGYSLVIKETYKDEVKRRLDHFYSS